MLRNYAAVALRHLLGQRLYSAINVLGLAIGLACFILIAVYVRHEQGYDTHWANAERIYRISRTYFARDGARDRVPASANAPIAPALAKDFPEVERAARVFGGRALLRRGEDAFYEERVRYADPELLSIFDLEWLAGDPATALAAPNSLVLNESLARKYFGAENPIGATVTLNGQLDVAVTGVLRDLPPSTHLSIDGLVSLSTMVAAFGPQMLEQWNQSTDFHTYVLLREGARVEPFAARLPEFLDRYVESGSSFSGLTVTPIRDIHLRSTRDEEWKPPGSLAAVYGFVAIAVGVLLIACVNFTNLATARAATRAREVALRKTVGARRGEIIRQFLGESILLAAAATLLAVALVELALPTFNGVAGTELRLDYFGDPALVAGLVALAAAVGLLAGSYPAFYLSAFRPGAVLRGDVTRRMAGAAFRSALVVVQFAIAIVLLIGTAVVVEQMRFARSVDLGFDKEHMIVLSAPAGAAFGNEWQAMKQALLAHPGVHAVSASHYTPFTFDDNQLRLRTAGSSSFSRIQFMMVDHGFFETYGIELLAGRTFSPDFEGDRAAMPSEANPRGNAGVVVNETAVRLLGLAPADAVGQAIQIGLDDEFRQSVEGRIVGVVRDTLFESVEMQVRPLIFLLYVPGWIDVASIRVAPANLPATLAHIDATWREFHPDRPVDRRFLDEDFDALYRSHDRQGRLLAAFAALAVLVACLGLLGLTSYTTEQRTKEIGIRKVVGGSVLDIVRLFTAGFGKLVLVANLIAWPVAYVAMREWLAGFAYRIDLGPLVFVASGVIALAVAFATVGAVAARAAATKPIESLRYE